MINGLFYFGLLRTGSWDMGSRCNRRPVGYLVETHSRTLIGWFGLLLRSAFPAPESCGCLWPVVVYTMYCRSKYAYCQFETADLLCLGVEISHPMVNQGLYWGITACEKKMYRFNNMVITNLVPNLPVCLPSKVKTA
jgi:hypothetical protein